MGTTGRFGTGIAVLSAVAVLAAQPGGGGVRVSAGSPEQRELAAWAVGRFEAVGLVLPEIEVRFHDHRSGCHDRSAYYEDGVVDMCREHLDLMTARTMVHELAHAWVDANLTAADRDAFLELRGLETWNDWGVDWDLRGYEHAAEIIAWGLGDQSDGTRAPSVPDNEPGALAEAFEFLTGRPLPELRAANLWEER